MSSLNNSEISADDATYISNFQNKNFGIVSEHVQPVKMQR